MTLHADVFADALDGATCDLLEDTERLLGVVGGLHGLPGTAALSNAGARPDFRSELRARLLEQAGAPEAVDDPHAKVVPITSRWNQSWARRNRTRLLTSAAAGVIVITAVSVGASNALPGNPLYPVKRGGESVEYALAGSDEARGKVELSFARTRLDEIGRLTSHDAAFGIAPLTGIQAAGGTTVLATSTNTWVVRLFGDMDGNAVKGSSLLQKSFKTNPRPAPLREVQEFALFQEAELKALKGRLAGPALSKATNSLNWATAVAKQTTAALVKCKGNTCPAAVATALSSPGAPPTAAPTTAAAPSASPNAVPSLPSAVPSAPVTVLPVLPVPAPASAPVTEAPPQATPPVPGAAPATTPTAPSLGSPSPSDTPTTGTGTDVTVTPPPSPSTTTTPTSPPTTESPSAAPSTSLVPVPVTTPAVPTTAPVGPTTAPPTTDPATPTPAPPTPAPPTTAPPTIDPVTTTPAPPTTAPATVPPTVVPPTVVPPTTVPTTAPAPVTTTDPPVTTAPPTSAPPTSHPVLICLPGGHLINGICVHIGPPGRD